MASRSRQPAAAAKESILTPVLTLKGHTKSVPSISYFPDGKRMISGSLDGTARRWDLEADKEIEEPQDACKQEVHAVAVSRDGRWVVVGGGDTSTGELRVCQVETGIVRTFKGHSRRINCIDISANSALLASGSFDLTVRIWSLDTGKLVAGPFHSFGWPGAVRFSQNSKKFAVISNVGKCLEVWDVQTQSLNVRMRKSHFATYWTYAPAFWTTKDKTIVAAFGLTDFDSTNAIYEFDASTLKTVGTPFKGHTDIINGLALSFDCALLASGSNDHTIKLWAFDSRELLASFHVLKPRLIIFSPDSSQLAYTAWKNGNIYLCNTPPEILANIQPAQQVPGTSAPVNTPFAHLPNSDAARTVAIPRNPTIDCAGAQTPAEPRRTASPTSRGSGGTELLTVRHAGTSHIQPADMRSPTTTDMQRQHYDSGLQLLPQDLVYAHGEPKLDLPGTATDVDTVLSSRNNESDDPSPGHDAMVQDLTKYITKNEEYLAAHGGFGDIWKCTYSIDRRPIKVAVKALHAYAIDHQLGAAKTKKNKSIQRELRICAKLKHKNILPVYGYTYNFGPYVAIVNPWAENGNLTGYLDHEGAALTVLRRFQILRDIIAGLQYLHANSVIHGDFNGPNVLIHGDGTACVADFGLSLMYSEVISASQASYTSTLKGNVRWMAPELLVPEREHGFPARPSEQSDIFSFGGIMLQVLTNNTPYYYLRNDAAISWAMQKSETPSRSRYPVLPEKYWDFIEQCWSTDPRDRPSTEGADGVIRNEYYTLSRSS